MWGVLHWNFKKTTSWRWVLFWSWWRDSEPRRARLGNKLLSAPFGRYRLENLSLSCNLKRFLAPNDLFQNKSHPFRVAFVLELMAGLEPATCWLRISCSTNWATSALFFHNRIIIPQTPAFCNRFFENIFSNFPQYFAVNSKHILIFGGKYDKIDVVYQCHMKWNEWYESHRHPHHQGRYVHLIKFQMKFPVTAVSAAVTAVRGTVIWKHKTR